MQNLNVSTWQSWVHVCSITEVDKLGLCVLGMHCITADCTMPLLFVVGVDVSMYMDGSVGCVGPITLPVMSLVCIDSASVVLYHQSTDVGVYLAWYRYFAISVRFHCSIIYIHDQHA